MGCLNSTPGDQPDGPVGAAAGGGEVIFFPDDKMPCHYGRYCRSGRRCEYAHTKTSLTRFLAYLNGAKHSLDICVFTITCKDIADAIQAAHSRKVAVRIITDYAQTQTLGSNVKRLAEFGISVRLDNSENHMHHKFAVVDNRLLLNGSFNWTRQAVLGNRENVMVTTTPQYYRAFIAEFNKLWALYKNNPLH